MEFGEEHLWQTPGQEIDRQNDGGGSSSGLLRHAALAAAPQAPARQTEEAFLSEGPDGIGVEGARVALSTCRDLGIGNKDDMQKALTSLEEDFRLWMHPGFVSAWHSDRILEAELQSLSVSHADDVWRYKRACIGIRTQTLSFSGMDGSWKPLQAALSQVAGQGSCLRLQAPKAVAREAIQWLGPLLPLLSVQLAAEWSRGQWLIRQHTAPEEVPTPFAALLCERPGHESDPDAGGRHAKNQPAAGHRRTLWGRKQRMRQWRRDQRGLQLGGRRGA